MPGLVLPFRRREDLGARTDDELLLAARAGARAAFDALVARHMGRLVGYCARLTGDPRAAEELAQEVWLTLWIQRERFEARGRLVVWLYTAARSRCYNHARDAARRRRWLVPESGDAVETAATSAPAALDAIVERERQREALAALAGLSDKLRDAVTLRVAEGLDYADVAAILSIPEGTARSRVHLGLAALRAALGAGGAP